MAINDIVQTVAEARVDARSLSEFVFKPAGFKVTRRLAPTIDTLQFYVNSLSLAVTEAQGKVQYIETTVQDAINNTAVEAGVLADTFVTVTANGVGTVARTQKSKNGETVSVYDFGAVGDGMVDDTANIQKALDYIALVGKTLLFPRGSYLISGRLNIVGDVTKIVSSGAVILLSTLDSGFRTSASKLSISISGFTFDGSSYGTYAEHLNDPFGQEAISVKANVIRVSENYFIDIYGAAVQAIGTSHITANILINVAGFNPDIDTGGQKDNYGDGIRVSGAASIGGEISGNYLYTANKGRAGIVVEFNSEAMLITGNYISGYNQSIHTELCKRVNVISNYCERNTTALIVSTSAVLATGNYFKSGGISPTSYNQGTINLYVGAAGTLIRGNTIIAGTSNSIVIRNPSSFGVAIENNDITGSVEFNEAPRFSFTGNKLTGGNLSCAGGLSSGVVLHNEFIDVGTTFGNGVNNIKIRENIYRPLTGACIALSNIGGGIDIENNRFIPHADAVTSAVTILYSTDGTNVKGDNRFNSNVLESDLSFPFFKFPTIARHQPFKVTEKSYRLGSDGTKKYYNFSTAYDDSGDKGNVIYKNAIPTTGSYNKGDIAYNNRPAVGGFVGWVCTVGGDPATWVGFGLIGNAPPP